MQSGITASQELQDAFQTLVSSFPAQRGLTAGIKDEKVVLLETIDATSNDFFQDLSSLQPLIKEKEAAYIILRRYQNAPDGFVAVTYVPDVANVRQKMLFASTRLTLVRELGTERFRESIFATTKQELTAEGWRKHDASGELKAPLTEEEKTLQSVKDAEAEASQGTTYRRVHISDHFSFPVAEAALQALKALTSGGDNLVQLKVDAERESIELATTSSTDVEGLALSISSREPRFSFFRYTHSFRGHEEAPIVFLYTHPDGLKVKERMLYASSKNGVVGVATQEGGFEIAKKLEASSPSEITLATIEDEFRPKQEQKKTFSRPKPPGKR